MDDENLIWIVGPPTRALQEPAFIIKVGDVYYVTKAVWEYDISKAVGDQTEGCEAIQGEFNGITTSYVAKKRLAGAGGGANETNPGPEDTG